MKKIVVAGANKESAQRVKKILTSGGFEAGGIFSSGTEVLSYATIHPPAVIVCGRLFDMSAVMLADMLPQGFDVINLLSSGQSQTAFRSNLLSLHMPINIREFLDSVRSLAVADSQSFSPKKVRSREEERSVNKAKDFLMARYHISENQAHKMLQKRSMDKGLSLAETALLILGDNE